MKIPAKIWARSIQSIDELKGKAYFQTKQGVRRVQFRRDRMEESEPGRKITYRTEDYQLRIHRELRNGYLCCYAYGWILPDLDGSHPIFKNYWHAYSYHLRLKRHGVRMDAN